MFSPKIIKKEISRKDLAKSCEGRVSHSYASLKTIVQEKDLKNGYTRRIYKTNNLSI